MLLEALKSFRLLLAFIPGSAAVRLYKVFLLPLSLSPESLVCVVIKPHLTRNNGDAGRQDSNS